MADSSTLAMPSMISPSPGIISPADTTHSSSSWSWGLGTSTISPLRRTWAIVSERALRSESACALPRPSAIASAKLANSTVNHSQAATRPAKRFCVPDEEPRSRSHDDGGEDAADLHHHHHGVAGHEAGVELDHRVLGGLPDDGAVEQRARLLRGVVPCASGAVRAWWCSSEAQVLHDRPEGEDGEVGQADDDEDDADEQAAEERRVGGEGARRGRGWPACGPAIRRWPARGRSGRSGRPASRGRASCCTSRWRR